MKETVDSYRIKYTGLSCAHIDESGQQRENEGVCSLSSSEGTMVRRRATTITMSTLEDENDNQ